MFDFTLQATDGAARTGTLTTPHGNVETPVFMPVGTTGSVKALSARGGRVHRGVDDPRQHLPPLPASRT